MARMRAAETGLDRIHIAVTGTSLVATDGTISGDITDRATRKVLYARRSPHPRLDYGLRHSAHRDAALRHIAASLRRRDGLLVGCKLLLHQMRQDDLAVSHLVDRFPTGRFIVIYRGAIFRQYLSHEVARATSKRGSTTEPFTGTIRIDPDELKCHITEYPMVIRDVIDSLPPEQLLVVSYEELTDDPQQLFRDRVCPFVDVDYRPVTTGLVKRIDRPPAEVVETGRRWHTCADETVRI